MIISLLLGKVLVGVAVECRMPIYVLLKEEGQHCTPAFMITLDSSSKEYRYFNVTLMITSSEGYPCMLFLWLFIFFFGRQKNITLIIIFVCKIEGCHLVCYVVAWHLTRVSTRLFAQIIVRKYSFPASLHKICKYPALPCPNYRVFFSLDLS